MASKPRVTSVRSVVFPDPVPPMIPVIVPGRMANERSCSTARSLCGYAKVTSRISTMPVLRSGSTGEAGSDTDGIVRTTSSIRCALASARGTRMTMKTAIITANRIWKMYMRNAVRLPIGIAPLSTR